MYVCLNSCNWQHSSGWRKPTGSTGPLRCVCCAQGSNSSDACPYIQRPQPWHMITASGRDASLTAHESALKAHLGHSRAIRRSESSLLRPRRHCGRPVPVDPQAAWGSSAVSQKCARGFKLNPHPATYMSPVGRGLHTRYRMYSPITTSVDC